MKQYGWLADPGGVVEPLTRVEGEWKDAWAERLTRPILSVPASEFKPSEPERVSPLREPESEPE